MRHRFMAFLGSGVLATAATLIPLQPARADVDPTLLCQATCVIVAAPLIRASAESGRAWLAGCVSGCFAG